MSDEKKNGLLARVMSMFRSAQPASEMSGMDLNKKLYDALRPVEPNLNWVETYLPVKDPNRVVFSVYERPLVETAYNYPVYCLYERAFTLGENGVVEIGEARVEVEPVITYEPVLMNDEPVAAAGKRNSAKDQAKIQAMHDHATALGANCEPKAAASPNTPKDASCSCQTHVASTAEHQTEGEEEMNREQVAEFLKTATEEDFKTLGVAKSAAVAPVAAVPAVAAVAPVVAAVAPVAPVAPVAAVVAPAVVAPTLKDLIASADQDTREAFESTQRVAASKKAATIVALKATGRNPYSDEDLGKMGQAELDRLVALAGPTVRAAIDFSGNGVARTEASTEVPGPSDLGAAIVALRAKK